MHICIDSCVFIHGLQTGAPDVQDLIFLISSNLRLFVPRLVAKEVTRNLHMEEQLTAFYHLFVNDQAAAIIDSPIPHELVAKYSRLGLLAKADAFIGAFAEWQGVAYLISDNRHFLRDLQTTAFQVLSPTEFVMRWRGC